MLKKMLGILALGFIISGCGHTGQQFGGFANVDRHGRVGVGFNYADAGGYGYQQQPRYAPRPMHRQDPRMRQAPRRMPNHPPPMVPYRDQQYGGGYGGYNNYAPPHITQYGRQYGQQRHYGGGGGRVSGACMNFHGRAANATDHQRNIDRCRHETGNGMW